VPSRPSVRTPNPAGVPGWCEAVVAPRVAQWRAGRIGDTGRYAPQLGKSPIAPARTRRHAWTAPLRVPTIVDQSGLDTVLVTPRRRAAHPRATAAIMVMFRPPVATRAKTAAANSWRWPLRLMGAALVGTAPG
jgi:hypothetical protein